MEEYKKGEHTNWDSDQEIQTWKKREAMLAAGEDATDEEDEDEEESASAVGSQKEVVLGGGSKQVDLTRGLRKQLLILESRLRVMRILPETSPLCLFCINDECAFWRLIVMYRGVGPYFCMNIAVCRPLYLC